MAARVKSQHRLLHLDCKTEGRTDGTSKTSETFGAALAGELDAGGVRIRSEDACHKREPLEPCSDSRVIRFRHGKRNFLCRRGLLFCRCFSFSLSPMRDVEQGCLIFIRSLIAGP